MFDFTQDYILENSRLRLTPLCREDYDKLLHFSIQEPELWTYSLIQANTPEKLANYIDTALKGRLAQHSYAFTVYDKASQQYAGSTRFYDIQPEQGSLQLGYTWYGKAFQGTGLNTQCKFLLLQFAFEVLQMERVEFRADCENARSIQAMKNLGCTVEGILRSHTWRPNGMRRDSIVLSILKHEWNERIRQELEEKMSRA